MRVKKEGARRTAGLTELCNGFDRNVPLVRRLPIIRSDLWCWAPVELDNHNKHAGCSLCMIMGGMRRLVVVGI